MKILQISDIHWKNRKKWNDGNNEMKNRFIEDVKEYVEINGKIDYVFICGDIVFKGEDDEYILAGDYIDKICEAAGCTNEDVFTVPGNHDLNRKAEGSKLREMLNIALADEERNNNFLDEVILKSSELRNAQFKAFEAYNRFAKKFLCGEELMEQCVQNLGDISEEGKLYYHERLSMSVGNFTVCIRGVNTALNCDAWDWNTDDPKGHKNILPRRAYVLDEDKKQEVRIFMGHHPLPFLTSNKEVEDYLNRHYHIQIFGHVHKQNVEGQNHVRVQSGAFDPPSAEFYKPIYNILEINEKDDTHIVVKGTSQIWRGNKFQQYSEGCFEKEIEIEKNENKWRQPVMVPEKKIDKRSIKFKFIRLENRTTYFNKVAGVQFEPNKERSDYDICLDFLAAVEKAGKLDELNKIMG